MQEQTQPQPILPLTDEIPVRREKNIPPEPRIVVERPGIPEAIVAAFTALGYALSARLILSLSLIGAFVLGVMAVQTQTNLSLFVLIAFCLLTVLPSAALELFGKRPSE